MSVTPVTGMMSSAIPISAEVQAAAVSAASHHHHHHLVDASGYVDNETWSVKNARIANVQDWKNVHSTGRIIALRKEKSRDAARSRRGKENYEFYELAKMLPLPAAITSQLDKASIIRLTISYLRMRDFSGQGDPPWHSYIDMPPPSRSVLQGRYQHSHSGSTAVAHELYEHNLGSHILQSLDGFLFALCSDGRFLYISETVSIYLGLSQVELTGSSVFDYVHPGDHAEVAEQLGMKLPPNRMMSPSVSTPEAEGSPSAATSPGVLSSPTSPQDLALNMSSSGGQLERSFIIRMKSTLCKRGIQITSSGYKVIHITGSLRTRMMLTQYTRHPPVVMGFVALAYSLPPPTISEIHLDPTMFVCKVDLNLNVTFCENKISEFLDYVSEDVVNKSLYSFLHAQDIASIRDSHADLLNKGQVITKYFRWMCKAGGYIWVQATATLTYSKNSTDKSFIFINQVLSKMEDIHHILDISQMTTLPPDLKSDSSGDSPRRESDSSHHTDSKKSKNSPRSASDTHQDQSKKSDSAGSGNKPTKGRRRKCNPESKESKKRKVIGTTAVVSTASQSSGGAIVSNSHADNHRSKVIIPGGAKVKEHEIINDVRKASPPLSSSPPIISKNVEEVQEIAKKPKIFSEDQSDPESGEIQVTHVLERTLVEERGGTPSTELTSNRLSPMIATQPNGHHREPELPVAGSGGHRGGCAGESWENPPNKEIPHNHRDTLLHVQSPEHDDVSGHIGGIIVPKVPYSKSSATSPKPPESILTPPLSDSAKSQYPLTSQGAAVVDGMTSLRQDNIDISRSPPATANSSSLSYANSSSYANSASYAKSFLSASRADLASTHPALLAKTPTTYDPLDSQSNPMKQEPLYNTHPRVITAVSSAYTGMPYGNYSQYNNFQQYGSPVNLAAAHSYQTNPYTDHSMYKNYRSGHEMPMDLSYNNVGSFSNAAAMSLLHSNVSAATGSTHPYFHASKMSYSASDGGIHSIHDKAQVEEAVRAAQQKV